MSLSLRQIFMYLGQAVIYTGFALFLGTFANSPEYLRVPEGQALIKLSFAHGAKAKGECRKLTREELQELAANMRRAEVCPRERLPVTVRLVIDGDVKVERELPPSGLHGDGPSKIYERIVVPPGDHTIELALRDTVRDEGFDYETTRRVTLTPGQSLAIDFHAGGDGFMFQ